MIYFLLIWILLTVNFYLTGITIINFLSLNLTFRIDQKSSIYIWIGMLTNAVLLLGTSLFIPLSFSVAIGLLLFFVIANIVLKKVHIEAQELLAFLSFRINLIILLIVSILLIVTTVQVTWLESAWYHYSSIRWLSEFGSVTGIVLILKNLGIVSSWFALNAPWNSQAINFTGGAVINGLAFLFFLIQSLFCWRYILLRSGKFSDYFFAGFSILCLISLRFRDVRFLLISPSPDLPIILLIGVVAWLMIITLSMPKTSIIPLLLSAGAVTIKLSALPLLLITIGFYVWQVKGKFKQLVCGGLLVLFLLLPMFLVGIKTSGCLFYPQPNTCFDLPWSLPREETKEFTRNTDSLTKWFGAPPENQNKYLWLFTRWLNSKWSGQGNLYLFILAIVSYAGIIFQIIKFNKDKLAERFWVSLLGALGILFIFSKGPLLRFGLGYFILVPALCIGMFIQHQKIISFSFLSFSGKKLLLSLKVLFITLIMVALIDPAIRSRWLWPEKLIEVELLKKQTNNVTYYVPYKNGSCWAAPLPCVPPIVNLNNIQLSDPSSGIRGGFIRSGS